MEVETSNQPEVEAVALPVPTEVEIFFQASLQRVPLLRSWEASQ